MVKAVLLDFYGTIVHENKLVVDYICNQLQKTGNGSCHDEIKTYVNQSILEQYTHCHGTKYKKHRKLMLTLLKKTVKHFESTADPVELENQLYTFLTAPPVYDDSLKFLKQCPLPVIIVANIDTINLHKALKHIEYYPKDIATSEQAKAYKPNPKIFQYALDRLNLKPDQAIYVGDHIEYDIKGAKAAGIPTVWLNRFNKPLPPEIDHSISTLCDLKTNLLT